MLNVHDLERRWLKYKIKSFIPMIFITSIIVIGVISTFVYYPLNSELSTVEEVVISEPAKVIPTQVENTTNAAVIQEDPLEIEVPQNTQYKKSSKTLVLKPSLHFMDNIEEGIDPYISDLSEEVLANGPSQNYTNNVEETSVQTQQTPTRETLTKKRLTITSQKNESDLKDVIRRFKKNKNPALSLFIAKRYYELKQYQKSYNYALMTNEIDKEIDDSWIIFSKSLVKLGQHELAVVTLKSYLKSNKSSQAEILLRKIEAGTFR